MTILTMRFQFVYYITGTLCFHNIKGLPGFNTKSLAFSEMMNEAKKRKFDVLLVWKLDRLSRSLKDLINTLDELGHLGIHFISYDNNLDTIQDPQLSVQMR